jgi:hypothetical protein
MKLKIPAINIKMPAIMPANNQRRSGHHAVELPWIEAIQQGLWEKTESLLLQQQALLEKESFFLVFYS